MISLHAPETQAHALAHGWTFPWGTDPGAWQAGQTSPWEWSLEQLAQCMISQPWSPGRYENGHRLEANFLGSSIVALDFDEGQTLAWAVEKFARLRHIIATTKSHGVPKGKKPACDRFRVVLFLPHLYSYLPLYKSILAAYVELLGADEQVKDGARFFWPSKDIISIKEGFSCPELRPKKQAPKQAPAKTHVQEITRSSSEPRQYSAGPKGDPTTKAGCRAWKAGAGFQEGIRNASCFKAACDLFEANWDESRVRDWLVSVGTSLPDAEVGATIRSAHKTKRGN
jgi:hypothetical protein